MADAIKTLGIVLKMSTEEGSPQTFVTIGNVTDINGLSQTRNSIPTSNLSSTFATYMGGLADGGEVTFTLNIDPLATAHQNVRTRFTDGDEVEWAIVLTDTGNEEVHFKGFVTAFPYPGNMPFDDKVTATITVKVSGTPWYIA